MSADAPSLALPERAGGTAETDGLAGSDTLTLAVRTMGGSELLVEGLLPSSTMLEVRQRLGAMLGAPPFCLRLLVGSAEAAAGQTLADAGVAAQDCATVVLVRVPGKKQDYEKLFSELAEAINQGRSAEARRLVDLGAGFDPDGQPLVIRPTRSSRAFAGEESPGCTVLALAIRERLTELALVLVERGVDFEMQNDAGRPALAQATIRGLPDVVDALLAAGAKAAARDGNGRSALFYALRKGDDALGVRLLRAGLLEEDRQGLLAGLYFQEHEVAAHAAAKGMRRTAQALLDAGFPTPPSQGGRTREGAQWCLLQ